MGQDGPVGGESVVTLREAPESASALVVRAAGVPHFWDDLRLQQLWISLQQRAWRSLALVSAGEGVSTLEAANVLAKIAWAYSGEPTCVFDMRDLTLRLLEHQLRDMATQLEGGERIFIPLRSTTENPTAVPLARAADAIVLCVTLGETTAKAAARTVEAIGRERFIGTILLGKAAPPRAKKG